MWRACVAGISPPCSPKLALSFLTSCSRVCFHSGLTLVVLQSFLVVGSGPCQGHHLCRGDGGQIQACQASSHSPCGQRIWRCQLPGILPTCPGLFLLSQLPVWCLSKMALSGFKLNSLPALSFSVPTRHRQGCPSSILFPWYTAYMCAQAAHAF